jgi:hypothetical protein
VTEGQAPGNGVGNGGACRLRRGFELTAADGLRPVTTDDANIHPDCAEWGEAMVQ